MSSESSNSSRDITWDYARGVTIFMIVLHHFYARFYESPEGHADAFVSLLCDVCPLPIFMYVSGLFAQKSINKYTLSSFVINKAIRLFLPFTSFLLIWFLIKPEKYPTILLDNFKDGYWFTFVLFEIMAVIACMNYLARRSENKTLCLSILFFAIITIFKLLFPHENIINGLFSVNLLWHYIPFFIIGFFSHRLSFLFKTKNSPIYLLIFILSFAFYYQHQAASLIPVCNLSCLLFLITIFKNGIRPLEGLLSYIGVYSLEIYLLHFFARLGITYIPSTDNIVLELLSNILLSITAIILSIYLSKLLKRSRLLSLLLFGTKEQK
jgi:peptidoglycan/LPS O-acetylase OafA/YrhL